jgi:hypothetical protein
MAMNAPSGPQRLHILTADDLSVSLPNVDFKISEVQEIATAATER